MTGFSTVSNALCLQGAFFVSIDFPFSLWYYFREVNTVRYLSVLFCILFLAGCAQASQPVPAASLPADTAPAPVFAEIPPSTTLPRDPIDVILEGLSLEERVGQLFLARCMEASALSDLDTYHLGGFILFGENFENKDPSSVQEMLGTYQEHARLPLLIAVDEEGGTVTRISRYSAFRSSPFPSGRSSCATGGIEQVLLIEKEKCLLLRSLGINVNLGPVCDISTEPGAFMYSRSLGLDAHTTGTIVSRIVQLMEEYHTGSVLKHFPGYGNNPDTHTGTARDSRTIRELEERDLVPFTEGIHAGCDAIMVSHTILEALDSQYPASLSPAVHDYLRWNMDFDGVIMTDDLSMGAISAAYGAGEAAVLAVLAGNDLLISTDYAVQYEAVMAAVYEGRISFDMLNSAVRRVLNWKMELGLL